VDGFDSLDFWITCLAMVLFVGWALFAGTARAHGGPAAAPSGPAVWPWAVGLPIVFILGCLAYFVFGGP
jgi:hypothetical protein